MIEAPRELGYASRHDDAAFAEIVRRYGDLVYSAARRQVNTADAAEVAQSVFIDLAEKTVPFFRNIRAP